MCPFLKSCVRIWVFIKERKTSILKEQALRSFFWEDKSHPGHYGQVVAQAIFAYNRDLWPVVGRCVRSSGLNLGS